METENIEAPEEWSEQGIYNWCMNELARFSHRPGTKISLHVHDDLFTKRTVSLHIRLPIQDVNNPHISLELAGASILPLHILSQIPEKERIEKFAELVLKTILGIEQHETREWCRRDGKPVSCPHKEPKAITDFSTWFTIGNERMKVANY